MQQTYQISNPTQRAFTNPNSFPKTNPINERSSHILLLTFLKNITKLFIVMTVLSIPLWIMNGISSILSYLGFKQYQQTKKNEGKSVQLLEYFLIVSTAHLDHCWTDQGKNSSSTESCKRYGGAWKQIPEQEKQQQKLKQSKYLKTSLLYDIFLQCTFLLGLALLEYKSFKIKHKFKGSYIEDYSITITGLPILHPYILLPKLEQYLQIQLKSNFQLLSMQIQFFDVTSACAEQQVKFVQLSQELQRRRSCGGQQQQIERQMEKISIAKAKGDIVWVTFQTMQARYLALRFLQSPNVTFMSNPLRPHKAPHPLEIIWQNLHTPFIHQFLSQSLSLFVCMGTLLIFDLVILYVYKSAYFLLAAVVVFFMEILLKEIILGIASKVQKHRYESSISLSLFSKLTKFLYINTALILFISSFDFGNNFLSKTFSTRKYQLISLDWFKNVGITVLLTFSIQIIYVNIRPFLQVQKDHIKNKFLSYYNSYFNPEQITPSQSPMKLDPQLDICYAHLTSILMFATTYTLTHPILYPLSAILCWIGYYTHKNHLSKWTEPVNYNSDDLNYSAIQYLYGSVVLHWVIVFGGFGFLPSFVLAIVFGFGLFFRITLIKFVEGIVRKRFGPFCFSKFSNTNGQTPQLSTLLSYGQLCQQIRDLHDKIRKSTLLYNNRFTVEDFVNKGYLQRYFKMLECRIEKLQKLKESMGAGAEFENNGIFQQKDCKIKGNINYSLP